MNFTYGTAAGRILQGASSSDTFQGMVFQLDKDELGSVVLLMKILTLLDGMFLLLLTID